MPDILAVDLGTSGLKVAVVDGDGRVVASAGRPLTTIHLPGGGAEQDAEVWWQRIGECAREVTVGRGIEAVAVTSQYMTIVPIDADGTPLGNAVMWMDERGYRHLHASREPDVVALFVERHGMVPMGFDDQGHMAVIRAERPDVFERAAAFVEPVDAINARLTGRIAATQTTAMPLMTVDNRTHGITAHDPDLVAASDIDPAKLPPLVPYDEIVGTVTPNAAAHLGITTDAVVVTGTIDSITSGIGCGVVDSGACGVIFGTTSVLVTAIDRKDMAEGRGMMSVPSPVPGQWFVLAENGVGGKALDAWLQVLECSFDDAERDASAVPAGAGGVLYQPWLTGTIAPSPDMRVRGGFVNLGFDTGRGEMTRAVYEGVARNAAWLLPHLAAFAGADWPSVRFGGGGASSPLWGQIIADTLGVAVDRLANPRTTNARGAGLLALAQLGHIAFGDIPDMVEVEQRHEPDPTSAATLQPLLEHHVDLFERIRPFYAAINRRR